MEQRIIVDRQTDRQTELSNCTFVKTILMLLVVLYHAILYWNGNWFVGEPAYSAPGLPVAARWLNSFLIYAFTLVSGYLFYHVKFEKGRYDRFLSFAANKAKRLLVPYLFVSAVWAVPFAVYFSKYDTADVMKDFVLGASPAQLWFLLMLFGVFVIFYPLSGFFQKHDIAGAAAVILIYGLGLVVQINVFQFSHVCIYIPFFWLGFKLRQHKTLWLRKIPVLIWLLADVVLFSAVECLSERSGVMLSLLHRGFTFLLHIVGALTAFLVLQRIACRVRWKESRAFALFSKNSMPIYLFHQQIVYVLIYWLNGVLNPYVHAAVSFIGAVLASLLISVIMTSFKWTRLLVGEK